MFKLRGRLGKTEALVVPEFRLSVMGSGANEVVGPISWDADYLFC